jgi:hypothetical protein
MENAHLWVAWMAAFLAIELPALFNKKDGDTWSEVVRFIFGFSKRAGDLQSKGMKLRRGSFYVLSAALIWHFTR